MANGWRSSASVHLQATGTSARVALPTITDRPRKARILNASSDVVFVLFGNSAVVATVVSGATPNASLPVPANGFVEILEAPEDATHLAAITASATVEVYITIGHGD